MVRTRPWEVSDQWWEKIKPLIPPAPSHPRGGRPRMDDRKAFAAIVYVLRDFPPMHISPAPTRLDASEDATHGHAEKTYP